MVVVVGRRGEYGQGDPPYSFIGNSAEESPNYYMHMTIRPEGEMAWLLGSAPEWAQMWGEREGARPGDRERQGTDTDTHPPACSLCSVSPLRGGAAWVKAQN